MIRAIATTGQLKTFSAKLERFARQHANQVARISAPLLKTSFDKQFSRKADPYGRKWAPRKQPAPWALMLKTKATRDTATVRAEGPSIVWTLNTPYAHWHQTGTPGGQMVARGLIPEEAGGVPRAHMVILRRVYRGVIIQSFG